MKKEIIIWQIIITVLGLLLIFILAFHLNNKNKIEIKTNWANCVIENEKNNLEVDKVCAQIYNILSKE